jgi:hypothetical protein
MDARRGPLPEPHRDLGSDRGRMPLDRPIALPHPADRLSEREPPRRYEDERMDRQPRSGRPRSPPRIDERIPPHPRSDGYPDERHGPAYDRGHPPPLQPDYRDRTGREDPNFAPLGPRSARYEGSAGSQQPRELFNAPPPAHRAPYEAPAHSSGRLAPGDFAPSQNRPPTQDPNYGRLNAEPGPATPVGPGSRQPSVRGARGNYNNLPSPRELSAQQALPSPSIERPNPLNQSSAPPTPTTEKSGAMDDTTGVHPSRLAQVHHITDQPGQGPSSGSAPGGPRGAGGRQSFNGPNQRNQGSSNSNTSNHNAPHNAPLAPLPTGPAANGPERRDGRQIANLNSHLNTSGPGQRGRAVGRSFPAQAPGSQQSSQSQAEKSQSGRGPAYSEDETRNSGRRRDTRTRSSRSRSPKPPRDGFREREDLAPNNRANDRSSRHHQEDHRRPPAADAPNANATAPPRRNARGNASGSIDDRHNARDSRGAGRSQEVPPAPRGPPPTGPLPNVPREDGWNGNQRGGSHRGRGGDDRRDGGTQGSAGSGNAGGSMRKRRGDREREGERDDNKRPRRGE